MHGIPPDFVKHATVRQLQVMQEVVLRDENDKFKGSISATASGVGKAFSGK